MRYSTKTALAVNSLSGNSNKAFFESVARQLPENCVGAILLVGSNDVFGITTRRAQSHLRLDRRPSCWSHAGVILDWNKDDVAQSWGVEVTLDPEGERHHPEHNGVTRFRLKRYADRTRYPNLAVAAIQAPEGACERVKAAMRAASLSPHRSATRYPLWTWIGIWARYEYVGDEVPNPLREGVPMPSAALVEMVLEAGGVAAAPGATELNLCPEMLWSTIKYWHDQVSISEGVSIARAWQLVRDPTGKVAPARKAQIEELDDRKGPRGSTK